MKTFKTYISSSSAISLATILVVVTIPISTQSAVTNTARLVSGLCFYRSYKF